jgi:hypothetical protein
VAFDLIAVAVEVGQRLADLGILHTTGGSIASSIAGEPRMTIDIDIVAAIGEADVDAIVARSHTSFTSTTRRSDAPCESGRA